MIHKRKTDTREKRSDAHEEDGEKNLVEDTHINLRNAAMCSLPLSLSLSLAGPQNELPYMRLSYIRTYIIHAVIYKYYIECALLRCVYK